MSGEPGAVPSSCLCSGAGHAVALEPGISVWFPAEGTPFQRWFTEEETSDTHTSFEQKDWAERHRLTGGVSPMSVEQTLPWLGIRHFHGWESGEFISNQLGGPHPSFGSSRHSGRIPRMGPTHPVLACVPVLEGSGKL